MPLRKAIFLTVTLCLFPTAFLRAQEQSDSDSLIRLDYGKTAELLEINGENVRKVIGPAEFMHNNTYMLCDTALWNIDTQMIDAMGNVSIIQEGTVLTSDKMVYDINNDLAQFRGVLVQLEDSDHNILRTSYLDYNTKDSVAVFDNGGAMRDKDGQLIESVKGTYDAKIKLFTFTDDVNMFTDSIFVKTTYLEYESNISLATFGRSTDAWKDESMLSAEAGWYDRDREVFFFRNNVHVMNDTQEGWSDSLYFYRNTTDVEMLGRAQVTDTSRNITAVAGKMVYIDSLSRVTMVREPALIARMDDSGKVDTVYVGADTIVFYSLRMCDVDSIAVVNAGKRIEEMSADPVSAYRAAAAEAERKRQEEALKNDPNYRPPEDESAMGLGNVKGVSPPADDSVQSQEEEEESPEDKSDRKKKGDQNPKGPTDLSDEGLPPPGIGREASDSLSFGRDSLSSGRDSLSFERDSLSSGRDSLSFGRDSLSSGRDSLSFGRDSLSSGRDSLSFGRDSLSSGRDSLSFGRDSLSSGRDSLSFGRDSLSSGRDSLSFERDSLSSGRDSLSFGRDSLGVERDSLGVGADSLGVAADSLAVPLDTTKVGFLWAVGDIRMYKDDMQMVCDSLEYSDLDSLVRMFRDAVIWNEVTQQYSADSVTLVIRNGTMQKASLMSEAYVVIEEDPGKFYDQVKSVEALAFFDSEGQLSRFDALGSATGAFYLREHDVVATANKTDSKMLSAIFVDGAIDKVYYFDDVKSDAYPVVQLATEERTFKGFNWQPERRPADPTAVTTIRPRPSMRAQYRSRPRAAFDQTELYFPGYIPGIYLEIAQRDSLERVRAHARQVMQARQEQMEADSLQRAGILALVDSVTVIDTTVFCDSLALADSLAKADRKALKDALKGTVSETDSTAVSDSLSAVDSVAGSGAKQQEKVLTKEELKAKALEEKAKVRAQKEKEKERRLAEKEEKWARLDSLDAAKVLAKEEKKAAKERAKKRKLLEKTDARNAVEDAMLESYVKRIETREAKLEAKGKPSKLTNPYAPVSSEGALKSGGASSGKLSRAEARAAKAEAKAAKKAARKAAKAAKKAGSIGSAPSEESIVSIPQDSLTFRSVDSLRVRPARQSVLHSKDSLSVRAADSLSVSPAEALQEGTE